MSSMPLFSMCFGLTVHRYGFIFLCATIFVILGGVRRRRLSIAGRTSWGVLGINCGACPGCLEFCMEFGFGLVIFSLFLFLI